MANITHIPAARVQEALKKADAAMAKLNRSRSKIEEKAGEGFKVVETVGAGLLVGYARGKVGEVQIGPGIPVDAAIGVGLSLAAFVDLFGKHSEHVHNLANGVLTTCAAFEAIKLAGGTVLSAEEVQRVRLLPAAETKVAGDAQKDREVALLNGNRRVETFGQQAVQEQETKLGS
jgi:hypothetical protein